jgi:hypothetical protein
LKKDFDLINEFTDYNDLYLSRLIEYFSSQKEKYKIFSNFKNNIFNYDFLKKNRYYQELDYQIKVIQNILNLRN